MRKIAISLSKGGGGGRVLIAGLINGLSRRNGRKWERK